MTLNNDSIINKHKSILSSIKRKNRINPMFLDRGQEFFSHLSKLEKNNKLNDTKSNKNNSNDKNSMELMQHKYLEKLGKQKEKYENELNYNYEIKCLDNWDFEHITKSKDIKTDNEFKQFLDEVDNSQMKWLVEIKNDKEQLQLMRRNKHLYDFLTQIDREQQAIIMQSMTVNKKGFNFEIFDNNKTMDNNIDIRPNLEIENNTNNQNDIVILNNEASSNNKNNVSQVEYYRQIMKEKIKVEEMFHTELKTVAEDCYLTNLNKKKAVINLFEVSQKLNALIKKEEKLKETHHKKLKALQNENKKQDKKKKNSENKNNLGSINLNYLSKYKDFKMSLYKKENNDLRRSSKIGEGISSESSSTSLKKINFQQQSEILAK